MRFQLTQAYRKSVWFSLFFWGLWLSAEWQTAQAQGTRQLPPREYYAPFGEYFRGNYRIASTAFRRLENSAYQFGTLRFLDSVCYWTMQGECNYQVGNYAEALRFYELALELYLTYTRTNWQNRIQDFGAIQVDNNALNRARINWGTPTRTAAIPRLPPSFGVLFGQLDVELRMIEGGVMQNPEVRQVDLTEIMRCVALAIQRRNQILGPTSKVSPFSNQLATGLRGPVRGDGSLFGAYNGVILGLAQASIEDWTAARQSLRNSLQFGNGFDHPLTPMALLELSRIAIANEEYEAAPRLALEASYSAAFFNQFDVVEEGIITASQIFMFEGKGVLPALTPAIQWARRERAHRAATSLAVTLAESNVEVGKMADATAALALNSQPNSRFALSIPKIAGRIQYVQAQADFQAGNFNEGVGNLTASLGTYRGSSFWLFRLGWVESLVAGGAVNERQADVLYATLLRDPNSYDWRIEPIEAMTFLASNHLGPLERWFEIVNNRKDVDRALEIADLARRHRFFAMLPLGGRLLSFRWMMHGPVECLSNDARQQRQRMLARYPQYQLWSDRVEQIRTALSLLPKDLNPNAPEFKQQADLLTEMKTVSLQQDAFLARHALSRMPVDMVFPPQIQVSNLRAEISSDQLAMVCFSTFNGVHVFFLDSNTTQYLGVLNPRVLQRIVPSTLKAIGASEATIDASSLQSEDWKKTAEQATKLLLGEISADEWGKYKELVVVPDGLLWYFPFELIQAQKEDQQVSLIDLLNIRYSPTLSLAFVPQRPYRELSSTAFTMSKVHVKGDDSLTRKTFESLVADMPEAIQFESVAKNVSTRLLATLFDQLVIWEEIFLGGNLQAFDLTPIRLGPANPVPLNRWLRLPLKGPEQIILSAFHSDAGNGLRGKKGGSDLFVTSLIFLGSGSRNLLLSRWRTGGSNSLEFTRNFAQKSVQMQAARAFQESLVMARDIDLDYAHEPQIKSKRNDPVVKADHPYFWATWMRFEVPSTNAPPIEEEVDRGAIVDPADNPANEAADLTADPKQEATDQSDATMDQGKKEEKEKGKEEGAESTAGGQDKN